MQNTFSEVYGALHRVRGRPSPSPSSRHRPNTHTSAAPFPLGLPFWRCAAAQGDNGLTVLTVMNYLAGVLEKLGRVDEAEALFRRTLAGREATLGKHHPVHAKRVEGGGSSGAA